MEQFGDLLNQGFLDIFTIFSLGMRRSSASFIQHFLLLFNAGFVVTTLVVYVWKGKLLISYDVLSQITDVFELFVPIFVHVFLIFKFSRNHDLFNAICKNSNDLDKKFEEMNPKYFKKVKTSSTFLFSFKFCLIHFIGIGIDTFVLIT